MTSSVDNHEHIQPISYSNQSFINRRIFTSQSLDIASRMPVHSDPFFSD